jgi:uncharacterized lipoprotein YddW (UPF0748 family)
MYKFGNQFLIPELPNLKKMGKHYLGLILKKVLALFVFAGLITISCCSCAGKVPEKETRAVWLWGSEVEEQGAIAIADKLSAYNMNMVCVLIKGNNGKAGFRSSIAPKSAKERDYLQELIEACKPKGIEVHAWFVFHGDKEWATNHPEDRIWHQGDPNKNNPDPHERKTEDGSVDGRVCPLSKEYREYFLKMVTEVCTNYKIDGIHLDYIRYPSIVYCFCPAHQKKAKDLGINIEKVREAIYKTFYSTDKDPNYYVNQYKSGNPDIVKWVDMRTEEITSMVKETRIAMDKVNPKLRLSAAFMPEGGEEDDSFALCNYSQSYNLAGQLLDFICPMSYHIGYKKTADWPAKIALNAEKKSGKAAGIAGLGVFETDSLGNEASEVLENVRKLGAHGFILFRYSSITEEMWNKIAPFTKKTAVPFYK